MQCHDWHILVGREDPPLATHILVRARPSYGRLPVGKSKSNRGGAAARGGLPVAVGVGECSPHLRGDVLLLGGLHQRPKGSSYRQY